MAKEESIPVTKPGSAVKYKTGSWRSRRPEVDKKMCIDCLQCWIYCPDNAIEVEKGKMKGFKYSHCKGCGICARECPTRVIKMVEEEE